MTQKDSQQALAGLRAELEAARKELTKYRSIEELYAELQESYADSLGEIKVLERRDKEKEMEVFKL